MTSTPSPYKVVAYEPGAASVIDRKTGERVGCVLQNFHGHWEGFLESEPGVRVTLRRYRAHAAADVWRAHTNREEPGG